MLRVGTEGIQAGQLGDGCEISNNVVALSAIDWKDAFQAFQDNSLQLAPRYGNISVHHNIFIVAADSLVSMRKLNALGDTHSVGDRVELYNNYFSSARFLAMYMGVDYQPKINETDILYDNLTSFFVSNSTFRHFEFQKTEIYNNTIANKDLIRVSQNIPSDIFLTDNELNLEPGLDRLKLAKWPYSNWIDLNGFSGLTGNSSKHPYGSITSTGNVRADVPPVKVSPFRRIKCFHDHISYSLILLLTCSYDNISFSSHFCSSKTSCRWLVPMLTIYSSKDGRVTRTSFKVIHQSSISKVIMSSTSNVCSKQNSITRALNQEIPHTGSLSQILSMTFVWPAMALQNTTG